jgi:hypothetical protein
MREGDAFFWGGGSVPINCKFDSSGLNLTYEGLLWLGMQSEGRKEIPDEAPPHTLDLH